MAHRVARRAEDDLDDIWVYVIGYRVEDADVFILRVVHGRRELHALFDQ